ncbi:MAG: tyrosine--tRNA ligase [Candidatus Eremiobacteraeota bacterium]|nr:tyrosine--tRNA ligase [Candidatus Eremiobacteraeota bacterium]
MEHIIEELRWRGFIEQVSSEELERLLASEKLTCYAGFDPSASSLHVGNLLVIMILSHFQRHGHRPIALIGGATGMIGDPSGKSKERNLLTEEDVAQNASCIKGQLARFIEFGSGGRDALLVNNGDWLIPYRFIHFLRDIGKHFRIGDMLAKESVRNRMDREEGISYTEFSYMIMQAYDFLHLFDSHGCLLQVGGNDQWGNITAGIELIRRLRAAQAYGLTAPLMTTSTGQKLGKTEEGSVWLDPSRTSPYQFYQYWVRCDDRDVIKYLSLFTYLGREEIASMAESLRDNPEKREAQKRLAFEVTSLVHSPGDAQKALQASQVLYGEEIRGLSDRDLEDIFSEVPSTLKNLAGLEAGIKLVELLCDTGLTPSKGAARKLISQGGAYLNNRREDSVDRLIDTRDLASEHTMVLRSGKKNYHLVRFH